MSRAGDAGGVRRGSGGVDGGERGGSGGWRDGSAQDAGGNGGSEDAGRVHASVVRADGAIRVETPVYEWEPSDLEIATRYGLPAGSILRFDMNTSPDEPPLARQRLAGLFQPSLNEYPDTSYLELTQAAAAYAQAATDEIVVGAGADEVLDLLAKAFLPSGGRALLPSPTYGMYRVLTAQRGAICVDVPRHGPELGYAVDQTLLLRAAVGCELVWLCWPNNPTGTAEPRSEMLALLEALGGLPDGGPLVVVDEAYTEYLDATLAGERQRYPRLVVVRTLSKAFGLAGIRVGFAVASRQVAARLQRVRPPGSISTTSAVVAAAALARPDLAHARVDRVALERERFAAGLREAGWQVTRSTTNFLLVRPPDDDTAVMAADRLLRAGCVPRTFGRAGRLGGYLRLTVRTPAEDDRLLAAISAGTQAGAPPPGPSRSTRAQARPARGSNGPTRQPSGPTAAPSDRSGAPSDPTRPDPLRNPARSASRQEAAR